MQKIEESLVIMDENSLLKVCGWDALFTLRPHVTLQLTSQRALPSFDPLAHGTGRDCT